MPDGKSILFTATGKDGQKRLYVIDETSKAPRAISDTGRPDDWVVSPDGKEIASERHGGRTEALPGRWRPVAGRRGIGSGRPPSGLERGWTIPVGYAATASLLRIERFELATGRKELWKTLAPPDAAGAYYVGPVLVTRDGQLLGLQRQP